jgi:hypothetical protein
MSWAAWSGQGLNSFKTTANGFGMAQNQFAGTGSVLCLDMLDIGLESLKNKLNLKMTPIISF